MTAIKIEMIHDLVCSWCPIGYSNLSRAIKQLKDHIVVQLEFIPFQLNPNMSFEGEEINAHLARRMGKSPAELATYRESLLKVASEADVTFNFDNRTHYYHSFKAHALLNAAQDHGKQTEALALLHTAYFEKGKNLADDATLADIAIKLGIEGLMEQALSKRNLLAVEAKEKRARTIGISSIPTFIINDTQIVQGSNSIEYFTDMLISLQKAA